MSDSWVQIGLLLAGALIGFVPTVCLEWIRWRQADRQSWRDERRRTYANFLVHMSAIERDTVAIARYLAQVPEMALGPDQLRHPGNVPEGTLRELVRERNETAESLIDSYQTLKLVSTTHSASAAKQTIEAYNSLLALARQGTFDPDPAWTGARTDLDVARKGFQECARQELLGAGAAR